MLTIFKVSGGVFNNEEMRDAREGQGVAYGFILTYMIIFFVLVMNLIVGQLSSAYGKYVKRRDVLMLLETLSVREASQADDKYSAAISPPYPLSIINLLLGTYVMTVKKAKHNKWVLHFYFLPTIICTSNLFLAWEILILPFAYVKVVFHKFALIVNNPQGAGAKSSSDRLGYAIFFIFAGPFILALDSIVDCFWFIAHVYKTDLDVIAKQK